LTQDQEPAQQPESLRKDSHLTSKLGGKTFGLLPCDVRNFRFWTIVAEVRLIVHL